MVAPEKQIPVILDFIGAVRSPGRSRRARLIGALMPPALWVLGAALAAVLSFSGCGAIGPAIIGPKENNLLLQGRYGELEQLMRGRIQDPATAPFSQLFYLCYAYSRVKRYNELFPCLEHLQRRIDRGDYKYFQFDFSAVAAVLRAEAYMELGNYSGALAEARTAYAVAKPNDAQLRIYAITGLALAHALSGDRQEASRLAAELEDFSIGFPFFMFATDKYVGLAKIYMTLGRYDRALDAIKKDRATETLAVILTGTTLWSFWQLPKDFMLNRALLETGDVLAAKAGLDKLLESPQTRNNGDIHWRILFDRGRIAELERKPSEALEFYRRAIEIIEEQRSTINTEVSKIGYVGDKQEVYHRAIAILATQGEDQRAFEYVERAKARALVDLLASKRDFAVASGSEAGSSLVRQLDARESEQRVQDTSLPAEQLPLRTARTIQMKEQLRVAAPELASLVTVTAASVREIQTKLGAGVDLIEYYYYRDDLYAFVVSRAAVKAVKLDGSGLVAEIMRARASLENPQSADYLELAQRLYRRVLEPVTPLLTGQNVVIVPHGVLHYLSFSALHTGAEYAIDRYSVRLLPSASVMMYLKGRAARTMSRVLAFGNPDQEDRRLSLRFAEAEAIEIAKAFARSTVLLRKEATETTFKKISGEFSHIHFATHGRFDSDAPLNSGLLLARDADNDGILTVGDLYSIRLNADLVTLSACETGLGKINHGDDLVGLTRGFLFAGANAIVGSLWPVEDLATAYLMTEFYSKLGRTDNATALRQAQQAAKQRYPHPFFWAAFQLTEKPPE